MRVVRADGLDDEAFLAHAVILAYTSPSRFHPVPLCSHSFCCAAIRSVVQNGSVMQSHALKPLFFANEALHERRFFADWQNHSRSI
jgi:hypothetical protein